MVCGLIANGSKVCIGKSRKTEVFWDGVGWGRLLGSSEDFGAANMLKYLFRSSLIARNERDPNRSSSNNPQHAN